MGKNRVTVWSNNMNCPLISASVESTSMLDPALKRAAVEYLKVAFRDDVELEDVERICAE